MWGGILSIDKPILNIYIYLGAGGLVSNYKSYACVKLSKRFPIVQGSCTSWNQILRQVVG